MILQGLEPHTIHGTGRYIYLHLENHILPLKTNHSCRYIYHIYTVRPMDPSWEHGTIPYRSLGPEIQPIIVILTAAFGWPKGVDPASKLTPNWIKVDTLKT